jgi:multiple sugar transport system permease protein
VGVLDGAVLTRRRGATVALGPRAMARTLGGATLGVMLLAAAAATAFPLVWMVLTSFKPEPVITAYPSWLWPREWTLEHYQGVLARIPFARYTLNSLVFAGGVTLVSLVLDCMAGYAFARLPFPGRNVLFVLVLVTLMLPFHVTLIPVFVLEHHLGLLNTYAGLILPRATNGFGIFLMRQFFLTLPAELDEAARIDGAGDWRIFAQVYMPLASTALATLALFHFMYNWNDFLWPMVMTTDNLMRTLPVGLALFRGAHVVEYGVLMAGSTLALLPMFVAYLFAQRYFVRGIAMSAIKG